MARTLLPSGRDLGRLLRRDERRDDRRDDRRSDPALTVDRLTDLPSVNMRLTVSPMRDDGRSLDARTYVEDLRLEMTGRGPGPAEIVVARPDFPGNLHGEDEGTPYLLRWVAEGAVLETVGRLMGRERIGPAVIGWRLRVTGPVNRVQRRRHARVDLAIPMVMSVMHDGLRGDGRPGISILRGLTVNLSEGGVLALLEPPAAPVRAAVIVRFGLAGERFALTGRVLRHQAATGTGIVGSLATAVQFDTPDVHGDRLRPLLFARQLDGRRLGTV